MKSMFIILISVCCLIFATTSFAQQEEFVPAPLPHYSEELGYGWETDIPVPKPEDENVILKVWRYKNSNNREIQCVFLDTNRDGNCDAVVPFYQTHKVNDSGKRLWRRGFNIDCEIAENIIKNFLNALLE